MTISTTAQRAASQPSKTASRIANRPPEPVHGSYWQVVALVAVTAAAYAGVVRFAFTYDDLPQIVRNPLLESWSSLPRLFVSNVWAHLFHTSSYYRPLFMVWLLLNRSIFALQPAGWHVAALGVHIAATLLLYRVMLHVAKDNFVAFVASLVFAIHPAHVESVAWISGATDTLMTAALAGAFLCWFAARRPAAARLWYVAALALYAAALLCKETSLALCILVPAYVWLFPSDADGSVSQRARTAVVASLPFVAVSVAYFAVRISVLKSLIPENEQPVRTVLLSTPRVLAFYAEHLLWPVRLSVFYDIRPVTTATLASFWLPLVFLIAVMFVLALLWRRSAMAAFGILLIAVPLAPAVVGLRAFGSFHLVQDRYLYLPVAGLGLLLGLAIRKIPGSMLLFGRPALQAACVAVIGALCFAATAGEARFWTNDLTLYTRGIQVAPQNASAYDHLANELYKRHDFDRAMAAYGKALELDPQDWRASLGMGLLAIDLNRFDLADQYLSQSISLKSEISAQYYFCALSRWRLGKTDAADAILHEAIKLWPTDPKLHLLRGNMLMQSQQFAAAAEEFRLELKVNPRSVEAAQALSSLGAAKQ